MRDALAAHSWVAMRRNPHAHPFLFATGIECSYPVITGPDGRDVRRDELEETGHYRRYKEDLDLVGELGIDFLRYGVPYYKMHVAPGKYDWSFSDEVLPEIRKRRITPIVDLCHFGVPDWLGNYQNEEWPGHFADFAEAFAKRYRWVRFYTPVNEISITAKFSAMYGWWNERLASHRGHITALKHCVRANILAKQRILKVQDLALFIESESTEYYHASEPDAMPRAAFHNQERFLSLDLNYGTDVGASMYMHLAAHGMTREEYLWFMEHGSALRPFCIMGNDYYATNEHAVPPEGPITNCGRVFGYYIITRQYFDRYHLPVMHTETNQRDYMEPVQWLYESWANMVRLKMDGVPIVGFTWYSLQDQVDWDTSLRELNHRVNPYGLCGLDRKIKPVGESYKWLVEKWRDILPMEARGLDLHVPGADGDMHQHANPRRDGEVP